MAKRPLLLVIPLVFFLPAILHAVGMGNLVFEVYLQTESVGKVLFDHSRHGSDCGSCHPKIFIQKNNSNHVTMQEMEKGKSCGACHNGQKAFSVAENCTTCHAGDILYKIKDPGNVTFPHAAHIEMFGCDECHPAIFKADRSANKKATMAAMEDGKFCGACHNGAGAFSVAEDCESCHML